MMKIGMTLHVIFGIAALIFGFYNLINQSGNNKHKKSGKTFYLSMIYVCLSALVSAISKGSIFFIAISIFTLYLIFSAYSSIKIFQDAGSQKRMVVFQIINYISMFFALGMIIFPFYIMWKNSILYFPVLSFFGVVMFWNTFNDRSIFKFENLRSLSKLIFLRRHIGMSVGAYIAAITAFLVNNLTIHPAWVLWILPTVLGSVFISKLLKNIPQK